VTREELVAAGYDDVIVATGVTVRMPRIEGIDHPKVLSYLDVLRGARAGRPARGDHRRRRHRLRHRRIPAARPGEALPVPVHKWMGEWGVDPAGRNAGGLTEAHKRRRCAASGSCSARPRVRARDWARPRAGCTAPRWCATAWS
jgi:2,4-dienoyl-CoA reductase (NADPH2)